MSLGPVMLDIEGLTLSPADRDLLREPAVGGLILFSRNYESVEQLADLVTEVRALRSPPLLVAVDHEGGRVQRFREGFTEVPPMQRVGREFDRDAGAGQQAARDAGWLIGSELRAVGIDLGFAPCVDLDWGVSEVIGARAFHRDPSVVADLADEFARGMRSAGMAAVAKHFPGHGAVIADSHLQLPVDRRDYGMILDDMRPYERLVSNGSIAAVMTAHIIYDQVDELPASFSAYWIQKELRSRLGFGGAVFCDDLSMKATAGYGTIGERARLALEAGCDMVPICNDRDAAQEAVDKLADYSNPLSLVRLARLHGTGHTLRESLLAGDKWQTINARFRHWDERPEFHLDA
ncbi:MAG: beta-N-acetylhexosaminidase [Gammaproteobacteria bacterium]|nr:beta-N-acetylhexosaminidase [Gammaproteobacteria bacterium]NNF48886.1 beta-N-acetylhexosaminidase [Woeseiaceae bacterium]MBT8095009.1 beta-N-acetylhexosaminidase [Gammaproteobacteria bacterium]MBT8104679.1 beta-N-acetylhexosaminidase [Gammaproteobacteria bacterium]NNK24693.1 beta-N-acetylhexosaminidase [Woeseiaceae bacterium]